MTEGGYLIPPTYSMPATPFQAWKWSILHPEPIRCKINGRRASFKQIVPRHLRRLSPPVMVEVDTMEELRRMLSIYGAARKPAIPQSR